MFWGNPSYTSPSAAANAAKSGNRKVFSGDMVPHVWAAQTQHEGRSSNGNIYFEGRTLFSYGSHFPLAVIAPSGVVFLNADKYSVTTSGHQSMAASAVSHMTRFRLPDLAAIHSDIANADRHAYEHAGDNRRAACLRYLRDHADKFKPEDADDSTYAYRAPNVSDAIALGAVFDLTEEAVRQALADGRQREADNAKARAAAQAAEALRIARQLATMNDDGFASWRNQFVWAARNNSSAEEAMRNLAQAEKQAADVLTRVRRLIKVARDAGDLETVAKLKARVAKQKLADVKMRADVQADYRKVKARKLRDYRATWRRLKSEGDFPRMLAFLESEWLVGQAGSEVAIRAHRRNRAYVEPHAAAIYADRQRQREVEAKLKREQEIARKAAALATWLEGGHAIPPRQDANGGAYMRKRGDYLQTSQGAEVPWSHALRVFALLKLCRERGEGWTRNGRTLRVGHFQVDSVKPDGSFVAGCHSFSWPEIERLALREGVYDTAPADTREAHA